MRRVPEREAAKLSGARFYETGKPCKNGHIAKRYTANGLCSVCAVKNTLACVARRPDHPNRAEARAAGRLHYSTGTLCKFGHDRRFVSNGICVDCSNRRCRKFLRERPGLQAEWARDRRAKNPTNHRKANAKWKAANPDKANEILARWKEANPERVRFMARAAMARRRARIAENGGTFTVEDIETLFVKQNGCCAVCPNTDLLEIDHVMPLVLGGSNDPSNLQLLCSSCNKSKGGKHPNEWRATLTRRLAPPYSKVDLRS